MMNEDRLDALLFNEAVVPLDVEPRTRRNASVGSEPYRELHPTIR